MPSEEPTPEPSRVTVGIRLPRDIVDRADALKAALESRPLFGGILRVSRHSVLALAVSRGIAVLEAEVRYEAHNAQHTDTPKAEH